MFEPLWELLTSDIGQFSVMGWTFAIGFWTVLMQVIRGVISLGKFTYVTVEGTIGSGTLGSGVLGAKQTVIKEFPAEG